MKHSASEMGRYAEQVSALYLQQKGVLLLSRNYRGPHGEIDIIGLDADTICFIEVRSRRHAKFADPILTIINKKRQRIINTALYFLSQDISLEIRNFPCRFDTITLVIPSGEPGELVWTKSAFQLSDHVSNPWVCIDLT